jgi:hypothetical protein
MRPLARSPENNLLVRELERELLVYDLARHRAHCLNRTAALVWQGCDGRSTVADLGRRLEAELAIPGGEGAVWLALRQLRRAHLLVEPVDPPAAPEGSTRRCTRRQAARRLGLAAAALLPLVTSIVAPTPAMAATTDCSSEHHVGNCCANQRRCRKTGNHFACNGISCRSEAAAERARRGIRGR